ncbi:MULTISPECIES: pyridoxamine 5'-phosphate oxidase family protein [Virgibacillus]|uniref:General stress protein 26 n=2 Tax=Virgibacillus TaxID=84406 RepID=A0A024Q860_9BACI|nr:MULTISPECIES: pyridoxamine 5'-phosphate oxidase family protein [Virgibacillus]EQB38374.1 general stress protein [Virgibacillus sp. CM-4]MYL41081.1 general stress protein [Virgibacillus massiliensis]GGJ54116.1 general stress protein 26 [Virgibacillus kapii]CDQ38116.1 General stress protein 26 [Virgibacillus massiliensis]
MSQEKLKQQIEHILEDSSVGTMATVKKQMPHSRYMTFFHENLTLYTPTNKETDKAEDIEANPYTHIILGYEGEGFGDTYVEYEGKVSFNESQELKDQLWNDRMKLYFDGPNDPKLTILEIKPLHIRLMNKKGESPQELNLS